jgi:CheY-like chemotaxis protein
MRILIVDDEPDMRMLVRMQLSFISGVGEIDEALNGLEALEVAGRYRPDVILLDMNMPVMCGEEALPRLRSLAPAATIIIHSAASANTLGSVLSEADGYVQKGRNDLVEVIAALVRDNSGSSATLG